MIEWINFILMLVFTALSAYYYAKSASIIQLERKIGAEAYIKCGQYRYISLFSFILVYITYVVYYFYPLPVPLPQTFAINGWILASIATLFLIPLGYVYFRAIKDAGEETMRPKKDNELASPHTAQRLQGDEAAEGADERRGKDRQRQGQEAQQERPALSQPCDHARGQNGEGAVGEERGGREVPELGARGAESLSPDGREPVHRREGDEIEDDADAAGESEQRRSGDPQESLP